VATLGATTGVLGGLVCAMIWRPEGTKGSAAQPGPQQGGSQLVRRVMACGMAAVLVVGLLAGCGSDGGDDDSIGTGSEATLHGYCTALLRMNREVGSLLKQDLLVRPWALSLSYWCGASSHQGGKLLELIFRRVLG